MESYSIADAKARLSEIIERVESGESVEITKRGKHVATLGPAERKLVPVDVDRLERLAARLPVQKQSAVDLIREMRDEKY